ncbi:MAG: hypothetical protein JXA11_06840 [Phycisphaerae bacterium]|nr:hypothetical protein [Phycisphaerae bacterium]
MTRRGSIKQTVLVFLVSLCVVAGARADGKTYTLRQQFQPGTYYVVMHMDLLQASIAGPEGQDAKHTQGVDMKQLFVLKMVVEKPDDAGNKTMTLTYARIAQTMKASGMAILQYDSMDPGSANSPIGQNYAPLLKAKIKAVLDKDDNITSVSGFDAIWEEMKKANPAMGTMGDMKQSFNDESLKKMIQAGQEYLPTKPVAVGDTWDVEQKIPAPMIGTMTTKMNMKLDSVEEKAGRLTATISVQGTAESENGDRKGPMLIKNMAIKQDGHLLFDIQAGRMFSTKMKQLISLSMAIAQPGQENDGQQSAGMAMQSNVSTKEYFNEEPPEMTPPADKKTPANQ